VRRNEMSAKVVTAIVVACGTIVLAQPEGEVVKRARVPTFAFGATWIVKDSATCKSRASVATRNTATGVETDRQDTPTNTVTTELERQVNLSAMEGAAGNVVYTRAVVMSSLAPVEQPLAVAGKTFPLSMHPGASSATITADAGGETGAIVSNDRVASLVASSGKAILESGGADLGFVGNTWSAIVGNYLGPSPGLRCTKRSASSSGVSLECHSGVAGGDLGTFVVELVLSEGGDWVTSTEVRAHSAKESRTKAAAPDTEILRTESRECVVMATQAPSPAPAVLAVR
jgi:hypothetical protein